MDDAYRNKLRFRAWRRGFREADLILGPFADTHVPTMNHEQLVAFETLLHEQDHDLYAWIIGRLPTPPQFDTEIMRTIKQFRYEALEARGDDLGA
jgi:antitoxin CptB